jgi:hypothetical protein
MKIYYDGEKYLCEEADRCEKCHEALIGAFFYAESWIRKKGVNAMCLCERCIKRMHSVGLISIYRFVVMVEKLPADAVFIPQAFPGLSTKTDMSVFEAAKQSSNPTDKTIDHTRLANRESWGGAQFGAAVAEEPLLTSREEVREHLIGLRDAELLLPDANKLKQIGDGR